MQHCEQNKIEIAKGNIADSVMFVRSAWKIFLIVVSFILALVAIYECLSEPTSHAGWSVKVSLLCLFWFCTYFICSYGHFKTPYLLTSAYVIPLSLFHLGVTFPASFELIEGFTWASVGNLVQWWEKSGWYTVLSLSCIGIGFGSSLKGVGSQGVSYKVPLPVAQRTLSVNFLDGVGLLLAAIIFLAMAIKSFGNLLDYSRVDFFRTSNDTRGLGLFLMVLPSAVLLLLIGAQKPAEKAVAVTVACCSFFCILLSGYRSAALFPAFVGLIVWVKVGRKMPWVMSLLAVLLVVIIIPVISMIRSVGPYKNINQQIIEKSVEKASAQQTFMELGSTAGVLAHVIRLVPGQDPYRFGTTYIKAFRDSIPNLMPSMSESDRAKARQNAINNPSLNKSMSVPSDWITFRVDRDKFNRGEGLGFSAIGEPYLNFGIFGVVLFFVTLGFLLGRLDGVNLLEHPRLLFFACAIFWPLVRTVRNDFGNFVKPAIFIIIIIGIWRGLMIIFLPNLVKNNL